MYHHYRDFYGCSAVIHQTRSGFDLRVWTPYCTKLIHRKTYRSMHGARTAMGRLSDGWREVQDA